MRQAPLLWPGRAIVLRLAILVAMALLGGTTGSGAADLYTASGVKVDVSADNAVAARKQAIEQAERDGLARLLGQLTAADDAARLPSVASLPLESYVRSYEVASEKVAPTRYLATINVNYRPQAVQSLLQSAGVAFVNQQSQPILIVPAVDRNGSLALWADNADWRQAWAAAVGDESVLRLVLPLGDIEDLAALPPAAAQGGDTTAFGQLAQRYQVSDVVLAVASPQEATMQPAVPEAPPTGISVALQSFGSDGLLPQRVTFDVAAPADGSDIWAAAALAAADRLRAAWKTLQGVAAGPSSTIAVTVPLAALATWVQIMHQLDTMPEVREVRIESFARDRAEVTLAYAGDIGRLQDAFGRRGLELSSENNQWQLLLAADQPAPPG
jgi:hypothetical protein